MPEARRCGQTQHLREKRRRALLIFAPNDGVIEFDHKTSLSGLHQPALRDRRLDEGSEERMGRISAPNGIVRPQTRDGPSSSTTSGKSPSGDMLCQRVCAAGPWLVARGAAITVPRAPARV